MERSGRRGAKIDAGTSDKRRNEAGGRPRTTRRAAQFCAARSSKGSSVRSGTAVALLPLSQQNCCGAGGSCGGRSCSNVPAAHLDCAALPAEPLGCAGGAAGARLHRRCLRMRASCCASRWPRWHTGTFRSRHRTCPTMRCAPRLRMLIALGLSLLFTFTYATLAAKSARAGALLIPLLDILQSVPSSGSFRSRWCFFLSTGTGAHSRRRACLPCLPSSPARRGTWRSASTSRCAPCRRNWRKRADCSA